MCLWPELQGCMTPSTGKEGSPVCGCGVTWGAPSHLATSPLSAHLALGHLAPTVLNTPVPPTVLLRVLPP